MSAQTVSGMGEMVAEVGAMSEAWAGREKATARKYIKRPEFIGNDMLVSQ
jgi:hypothetical protein